MASVVTPLTCTVEVIGRPKESKYEAGKYYYPTLFQLVGDSTDTGKIWKNLSGNEITQIQKGDQVQLIPIGQDKSGNTKHQIVLLDAQSSPQSPQFQHQNQLQATTPIHIPESAEQAFEELLKSKARRYGKCLKAAQFTLQKEMGIDQGKIDTTPELTVAVKDIATTLFIECNRH